MNKFVVIGGGNFGTAIANSLLLNRQNEVCVFSQNEENVQKILHLNNKNSTAFPVILLNEKLIICSVFSLLRFYAFLFIAIPSSFVPSIIDRYNNFSKPEVL